MTLLSFYNKTHCFRESWGMYVIIMIMLAVLYVVVANALSTLLQHISIAQNHPFVKERLGFWLKSAKVGGDKSHILCKFEK